MGFQGHLSASMSLPVIDDPSASLQQVVGCPDLCSAPACRRLAQRCVKGWLPSSCCQRSVCVCCNWTRSQLGSRAPPPAFPAGRQVLHLPCWRWRPTPVQRLPWPQLAQLPGLGCLPLPWRLALQTARPAGCQLLRAQGSRALSRGGASCLCNNTSHHPFRGEGSSNSKLLAQAQPAGGGT